MTGMCKQALKRLANCKSVKSSTHPRAAPKGQPTKDPSAIKNTGRKTEFPLHQRLRASTVVYMAKVLGRKAVDEMNIPGLKTTNTRARRLTFPPNLWRTDLVI